MTIKIEKDIPVPSHGNSKWPFKDMEIGDSFAVNESERSPLAGAAYDYGKRNNMKFLTRKVPGAQVRCWRIK
jgi:hypothetical protein